MMLQLIFTIVILFSILGILIWAYTENKALGRAHTQNVSALENVIAVNYRQVNFRKQHLNSYQFMQYNLHEALVVQSEIKL
ncbi:MAG TPA: hypothetical protein PKH16_05065 [Aequorivita sp.]|nr:hypothetical protein [Aequorivita sp.]MBP41515.1 hypothetical protein [Aequorivita sp.]HBC03066.1 hypothetical protein [Aequorivita sp.]HNP67256.1 hypothetical protein [Aequorivita sp.]|tara:strand:+ start:8024 stop:8266 length:243 start_codon:yes stop_codon:yes gene_type:complete